MRTSSLAALSAVSAAVLLLSSCSGEAPPAAPDNAPAVETAAAFTALNTPPSGSFRYTPAARSGKAPLAFEVNMCKTVDPDLTDDLRFIVSWGDGTSDRGLCYLRHTYERPGAYGGRACVSDRVLGSAESCEEFVVDVVSADETPATKPLVAFFTRTAVLPFPGTQVLGSPGPIAYRLLSPPILLADLRSAAKIVVEAGPFVTNTCTGVVLGLYSNTTTYLAGSTDLGGQLGTISSELTPSQFVGPGDLNGAVIDFNCYTGIIGWTPPLTFTVTGYR